MDVDVEDTAQGTTHLELLKILKNCLEILIVWLCSYFSKTKPIELKKCIKRQGKHLPPERRKFIRFPGDATVSTGKAGLFFTCKWLFLFLLVSFNPVMSESLISSTFRDVENAKEDPFHASTIVELNNLERSKVIVEQTNKRTNTTVIYNFFSTPSPHHPIHFFLTVSLLSIFYLFFHS